MTGVTLVTPTGGRPEALRLCERWITRQTYSGDMQWICTDDCMPRTVFLEGQMVVYPPWIWKPGDNTQAANLLLLLDHIRHDKVLFVEDDEWYGRDYVAEMVKRLDSSRIVGEGEARYYNVANRTWHQHNNRQHACLARTGIRAELIPIVQQTIQQKVTLIDIGIWEQTEESANGIFVEPRLSVGIKGMPGRGGIGIGHRPHRLMKPDPSLDKLREWIGNDVPAYEYFFNPS